MFLASVRRVLGLGVFFVLCANTLLFSQQLATASLAGRVTDPSGRPVDQTVVTLTNPRQGTERSFTTRQDGRFSFASLEAASFVLSTPVTQGFAPARLSLSLAVGQSLEVQISLLPQGSQTTVEVDSAAQAAMDTSTSVVGGVIASRQIESLPLNGRNYLDLSYLVPGNVPAPNFDPTKVHSQVVSTAGQVGRGGNVTIDGADNNDDAVGGPLVNIPEDAVQEFQIASNRFSAGVGRSGSSVINVVTRQGSNALHGSLSFFERDHVLQALPATYDPGIGATPPFHRQQYAASAGGPIRHDRAWWFLAMEDRRQLGGDLVGARDAAARKISRSFATAPLHDYLTTERFDWQATSRDRFGFRQSLELEDDLSQSKLDRGLGSASYRQSGTNHLQGLMAEWVRVFTPSLVNRLSFSDNNFVNNTLPLSSAPQITFPSLDDGPTFRVPQQTLQFRLQGGDVVTWNRGKHALSFGGEIQSIDADFNLGVFRQGNIIAVEDFPDFDRNGDGKVNDDDLLFAVSLRSSTPQRSLLLPNNDNYHLGAFFEDDFKASPRLSLNLGLRWEVDTNLNNLSWYGQRNPIVQSFYSGSRHRDLNGWAPRFGFNYALRPTLTIHGGYGVYFDRVTFEVMSLEKGFDGRALALNVRAGNVTTDQNGVPVYLNQDGTFVPGAPTVLSNPFGGFLFTGAGSTGIDIISNHLRNPMVQQFNFGFEAANSHGLLFKVDGVHNLGTRFIIGRPVGSVFNPVTQGPDEVTDIESAVNTKYDGLWVTLHQRLKSRGELDAAYTLGRAYNYANDDQIPFQYTPVDPKNLQREYGPPPNDQRHRLVLSGMANLPLKLHFAPIWTIASGVPMDILMPDGSERVPTLPRNAGGRQFRTASSLNSWIARTNAAGGVFEASAGKNVLLPQVSPNARFNDSFDALDFRLDRTFAFSDHLSLNLIGEAFNIFNVTNILGVSNLNYSGFANTLSPDYGNPAYSSSFGRPISTAGGVFGSGGPRAFQFAARLSF